MRRSALCRRRKRREEGAAPAANKDLEAEKEADDEKEQEQEPEEEGEDVGGESAAPGGGAAMLLHPKNPYRERPPDLAALPGKFPDLFEAVCATNQQGDQEGDRQAEKDSEDAQEKRKRRKLGVRLNFARPGVALAVSKALMRQDFGLDWDVPADSLCPPLPNRVNYLCWISDLLQHDPLPSAPWQAQPESGSPEHPPCRGLDVGTGASCIYPLLGSRMFGWEFLASDVDERSVACAERNVNANGLGTAVKILHVQPTPVLQARLTVPLQTLSGTKEEEEEEADELEGEGEREEMEGTVAYFAVRQAAANTIAIEARRRGKDKDAGGPICRALDAAADSSRDSVRESKDEGNEKQPQQRHIQNIEAPRVAPLDFVMTNPPFYSSATEIAPSQHTACSGSHTEMVTTGGELAFVRALIVDSLLLGPTQVRWYTAMLGIKAHVAMICNELRRLGVVNVHNSRLAQGVTMRWAVAWSLQPHPPGPAARRQCASSLSTCACCPLLQHTTDVLEFHVPFTHVRETVWSPIDDDADTLGGDHSPTSTTAPALDTPEWHVDQLVHRLKRLLVHAPQRCDSREIQGAPCIVPASKASWMIVLRKRMQTSTRECHIRCEFGVWAHPGSEPRVTVAFLLLNELWVTATAGSNNDTVTASRHPPCSLFKELCDCAPPELTRSNRRWRRLRKRGVPCVSSTT